MRRGFALFAWSIIAAGIVGFLYLAPNDHDSSQAAISDPPPDPTGTVIPASTAVRALAIPAANAPVPAAVSSVPASGAPPNRAPGMLPLEQAVNVGRATPEAAVQTAFWAILHKEDATLATCVAIEPGAREKIVAYLDRLPPAARVAYSTPEQFAALFLAYQILDVSAYQIVTTRQVDGGPRVEAIVTVRLRFGSADREAGMVLRPGPDGWALLLSGRETDELLRTLSAAEIAPK